MSVATVLVEGLESHSCIHDWMHLLMSTNRKEEGGEQGSTVFSIIWKFILLTTTVLKNYVPICVQVIYRLDQHIKAHILLSFPHTNWEYLNCNSCC